VSLYKSIIQVNSYILILVHERTANVENKYEYFFLEIFRWYFPGLESNFVEKFWVQSVSGYPKIDHFRIHCIILAMLIVSHGVLLYMRAISGWPSASSVQRNRPEVYSFNLGTVVPFHVVAVDAISARG